MSATSPSSSTNTQTAELPTRQPPGELLALPQLSSEELEALEALEAACAGSDGGRLKLEWQALRRRPPGVTSDFCWMVGDDLVGFVGLYQWRPIELEICGMVHPQWRKQGIGSILYEAAAAEIAFRQPGSALLIVDRRLEAGQAFARRQGGRLDHSEHRMRQSREPEIRPRTRPVRLRPAVAGDAPFVSACVAEAFDEEARPLDPGDAEQVARVIEGTIVIEDAALNEQVGVMRVEREGGAASIYGFAVVPSRQKRGYGRAALSSVTRQLRRSGVGVVSLEVLSTNDAALHLYETCGFEALGTEDYYSMPIPQAPPASP